MEIKDWFGLITAALVVIGAVWSMLATSKKLDGLDEKDKTRHEARKTEHDSLSNEHDKIAEAIRNVSDNTSYIKTEMAEAKGARNALSKKDLDLTSTFNHMTSVMEQNAALVKDNEAQRTEIKNQQQQIQQLHDENIELKTYLKLQQADLDYEPEL